MTKFPLITIEQFDKLWEKQKNFVVGTIQCKCVQNRPILPGSHQNTITLGRCEQWVSAQNRSDYTWDVSVSDETGLRMPIYNTSGRGNKLKHDDWKKFKIKRSNSTWVDTCDPYELSSYLQINLFLSAFGITWRYINSSGFLRLAARIFRL